MRIVVFLLLCTCVSAEDTVWTWRQWRITAHGGLSLSSGASAVCSLGVNDFQVQSQHAIPDGVRFLGSVGGQTVEHDVTCVAGRIRSVWRVQRDGKPGRSEAMLTFAGGDLAGGMVTMDDEAVAIPKQFVAHEFRHATSYRFFEDQPGKRLGVAFERLQFSNLRDFRQVPGRTDFQLFSITDSQGELALTIDLTRSADESRIERFDGERYAWLDDLHLPAPTGANLVPNPSFEGGLDQWTWGVTDWRDPPGEPVWSVDDSTAHTGRRSVRYTVHAGWRPRMLCTSPLVVQANAVHTVSFWARSDRPDAGLDVFAHFSEWGKFPLIQRERIGTVWTRHALQVTAATPFVQLCFGDLWWTAKESQVDGAHIWIDDIQVEAGATATPLAMSAVHCASSTGTRDQVLFRDELPSRPLQVTLTNASTAAATVTVEVQIQGLDRQPLLTRRLTDDLPAWGAATQAIDLSTLTARGLLRVVMTVGTSTFHGRIAVVERIVDAGRVRYAQRIDQPTPVEARWLQALGMGGSLSFELPDRRDDTMALAAMDWLHVTSPNGAKDCPIDVFHKVPDEAGWSAYEAWIARNVREHPGSTWWKTFNEPNCGGYTWTPADYVRGVEIMRRHLKAQDPAAMLLTPDCYNASRNGQAWLEEFLAAGGAKLVDAVAIHTYRARPEDPDLDHDIQALVQLKARHGLAAAPILFTEGEGHPPHTLSEIGMTPFGFYEWRLGLLGRDLGRSEITAAALMQRTWLACLKNADQVKLYLSWMPDAVQDQPRATLAAMNFVLGRLRHAVFKQELVIGDDTRCYVFEGPDGSPTAVLWSYSLAIDRGEKPAVEAVVPPFAAAWSVVDLMGNPVAPAVDDAGLHLRVSGWPLFIGGKPGETAALIAACEKTVIGGVGINVVAFSSRLAPGSLAVTASNRLARAVTGTFTVSGEGAQAGGAVQIAAKGAVVQTLPLPAVRAGRIMESAVVESFTLPGANPVRRSEAIRWFAIPRLAGVVAVDGDAAEWAAIAPISLVKEALMTWGDATVWKGLADLSARVRFGWRADGLYGCVEVTDDVNVNTSPIGSAWRQDGLQLYIDLHADGRDRPGIGYGADDQSITIAACGGQDQLWRDYTPEWQIAFVKAGRIANGAVAIRRSGQVTTYEFRLPPDQVFPLKLQAGTTLGLALLINDDDGAGMRRQALTLTPTGTEPHGRPELWPAAILVE